MRKFIFGGEYIRDRSTITNKLTYIKTNVYCDECIHHRVSIKNYILNLIGRLYSKYYRCYDFCNSHCVIDTINNSYKSFKSLKYSLKMARCCDINAGNSCKTFKSKRKSVTSDE